MVQDNVIRFIHLCESEHCHDKFLINLATINFLKKNKLCALSDGSLVQINLISLFRNAYVLQITTRNNWQIFYKPNKGEY